MKTETVSLHDLRKGDTIVVWWSPGYDVITYIEPYCGPLECMQGGLIAYFPPRTKNGGTRSFGMSLEPNSVYERIISL